MWGSQTFEWLSSGVIDLLGQAHKGSVMTLQDKVKRTIEKYQMIMPGDYLLVAVSGGPDTVALLHLLYDLRQGAGVAPPKSRIWSTGFAARRLKRMRGLWRSWRSSWGCRFTLKK